jgi:hypothetical protein
VLDHIFTDAIDALTQSLEASLLERLGVDEHLTTDLVSGDLTFETSYGLPGEELPPRVRADISAVWSASSQALFRFWYVDEDFTESPSIDMEITLRVQRLATPPDVPQLLAATPAAGPTLGDEAFVRSGPTVEQSFGESLTRVASAFEVGYSATYELSEAALEDSTQIDVEFGGLGGWIASALVRLNDVELTYTTPDSD